MQVQKYDCYSDGCFGVFRVEAFALAASETSLNISYRYAIGVGFVNFLQVWLSSIKIALITVATPFQNAKSTRSEVLWSP